MASLQPSAPWQLLSLPSAAGWGLAVRTCCVSYSANVLLLLLLLLPRNMFFRPVGSMHFTIHQIFLVTYYWCVYSCWKWHITIKISYYPVFNTKHREHSNLVGDKANGRIMEATDAVSLIAGPFGLSHILIRSHMLHSIPLKPSRPVGHQRAPWEEPAAPRWIFDKL